MQRKLSRWSLSASICLILISRLSAQAPTATLSGVVTDPSGAVIPGVTVTAISPATSHRTVATTNDQGFYVLTQLPAGEYRVEAEMSGFKKYVRQGLTLTTAATLALDIQLEVGAADQSVTVTGEAPLLQTRTSDVSTLIESKAVQDLPLGDRRTLNIVRLAGAAVFVTYDAGAKPNFSLAGGRTQSQMFWIDGGSGQNMRLGIGPEAQGQRPHAHPLVRYHRLHAAARFEIRHEWARHSARRRHHELRHFIIEERRVRRAEAVSVPPGDVQRFQPSRLRSAGAHFRGAGLRRGIERVRRAHGPGGFAAGLLRRLDTGDNG
jgi:hypothetical protein